MLNDTTHFAIVQITYKSWCKGDRVLFDNLDRSIPSHKTWEDLLGDDLDMTLALVEHENFLTLIPANDSVFLEDCIELRFCSVGDWACEWQSFFDHESESMGMHDYLNPHVPEILKSLDSCGHGSILTLWSCRYYQDWEGEWDAELSYEGVFEPRRVREILNQATYE
jgi:hypothetical protein